ncbi:MAG: hypothetical protein ACHP7E_12410, partial [Burkholderiales bacterium]
AAGIVFVLRVIKALRSGRRHSGTGGTLLKIFHLDTMIFVDREGDGPSVQVRHRASAMCSMLRKKAGSRIYASKINKYRKN